MELSLMRPPGGDPWNQYAKAAERRRDRQMKNPSDCVAVCGTCVAAEMTQSSCSGHVCDEREAEHGACRRPMVSTACTPFAAPAWKAGGLVSIFAPDQTVDRPAIRLSLLALLIAPLAAGCALFPPDGETVGSSAPKAMRDAVPTALMPGEQIDYAGHRCGNPYFYVKVHPCLFPRR
ncbi:hypothetical protein [Burkholderia diffusa]|uniref:hypothetical protein n=1 Tax=Burkholderia diffusa TaxID=488732 RepID=UPI001E565BE0|nr:hypothetical protein [Burkholderia diffusa]